MTKCTEEIPKPISYHVSTAYNESGQECHICLPEDGDRLYNDLDKTGAIITTTKRNVPNRFGLMVRKKAEDSMEPYTLVYPACGHIEHLLDWCDKEGMNSIVILDYITCKFLPTNLVGARYFFAFHKLFDPTKNE